MPAAAAGRGYPSWAINHASGSTTACTRRASLVVVEVLPWVAAIDIAEDAMDVVAEQLL